MRATKRYRLVHFYSGLRASTVSDWFWFFLSLALPPNRRIGIFVFYLCLFTPLWRLFIFFSSSKFRVARPASTFFYVILLSWGLWSHSLLIPVPFTSLLLLNSSHCEQNQEIFHSSSFSYIEDRSLISMWYPPAICIQVHIQYLALGWQYSWLGASITYVYYT